MLGKTENSPNLCRLQSGSGERKVKDKWSIREDKEKREEKLKMKNDKVSHISFRHHIIVIETIISIQNDAYHAQNTLNTMLNSFSTRQAKDEQVKPFWVTFLKDLEGEVQNASGPMLLMGGGGEWLRGLALTGQRW
jgi:hypothetical protein